VETITTVVVLILIMGGAAVFGFVSMSRLFGDWQTRAVRQAPNTGNMLQQAAPPIATPSNPPTPANN
jgi:hypothetical protein